MKKRIIMKLAALFMTGILAVEATCTGIGENTVYAAETDSVESESDGADSEFTGASGTGWVLDADGLLTISGDPEYEEFKDDRRTISRPEWYSYRYKITKVEIGAFKSKSMASWFAGCVKIKSISFASGFDTSSVTDMSHMFYNCSSLTSLDLSGWNTSNVTDMSFMFHYCSSLTSLDLSGWNTSNVTNMNSMFCGLESFRSLDLSGFDTSNVTDMSDMFKYSHLTSLDVSGFDTSNVTDMSYMFYDCGGLTSLDVSGFDTSNVTDMSYMFYDCSNLTSLDVSGFDTSKVTDMSYMFYMYYAIYNSLTSLDVSGFDTSNVTTMRYMFYDCSHLTSLDVSGFDTSKVTDMSYMFAECSGLTSLDVSGFDTSKVTDMICMFSGCSGLTSLDVSGWDTSNVTDMYFMFNGCSGLTSLDVSGFNTSKVTSMMWMFHDCCGLTSLDVSGFDTSNVTTMGSMFYDCSRLTSLDVSGFDTSNVTGMGGMFSGCSGLTSLDVSGFDTSNVKYMDSMFSSCSGLTSLDVSGFDTSNVTDMNGMFDGTSLEYIKTPKLLEDEIHLPYEMYDKDGNAYTSLPCNLPESIILYKSRDYTPINDDVTPNPIPNSDSYDPKKAKYTGVCGDSLTWYFYAEDQTLVVSGNGAMTDHPWTGQDYAKDIKKIILPDGMTEICEGAFNDLTGGNITIPKSVTIIAEGSLGHIGMVYGYKGSAAQKYAYANNMLFMDLDDPIDLNSVIYASANPTKNVKKNKKYVADAKAGLIDSSKVDTSYGVDNSPETLKGIVRQRASSFILCADRYYSNLGKSLVSKNKQSYDKAAIEAEAKGFICFDDNSCPDDYKQAVYLAVGELFNEGFMEYENGSIKKIDTGSWYSGSKFVNSVSEMVRSLSLSGEIKKVRVKSCNYTVRFGGMGVYDFTIVKEGKTFSKKTGHLVIKNDTVQPFLNAYMENLAELQKEQNMEVIKAIGKDIKRISGVSKLTDSYIDESVEANATVLKACGYGSLGTVLKDLKVVYGLTNEVDRCGGSDSSIGNCKDHIEMLKKITFSDPDLSNNELSKATNTLKSAYDDFLYALICYQMGVNPESYKTSWFTWGDNNKKWLYDHRIHCPVDIEVLDKESGERLGSIEDGVPEFDKNRLYMEVNGDHKSIYTVDGTEIVIKLIGKDDAFMDYSVEQISLTEGIVGRINYYDLPLTDGGTYTLDFPGDTVFSNDYIPDLKNPNGQAVKPSEYIDADRDDGYATISVTDCKYGKILGEGCYPRGDTVELSVQPTDDDYIFKGWFIDGEVVETDYTYQFTSKEDLNVEAVFAPAVNPYAYSYSTSLKLDKKKITGTSGEAVKLNAKVKKKGIYDVSINWISSNPAVASVFALPENAAEVRLLSPGTAYVTAVCGSKAKSVKVMALQPADKIEASINMISLSVKEKYRIPIVSSVPTTDKILFKSTAPKVCTVDEKGIVTAKAAGSAEIKIFTYDNKKASAVEKDSINVVVTNDMISETDVKDVSVNYVGNKDMYVGEKAFISLMIEGSHNGGGSLKYEYDHKIISIDKFGHVSAKKPGETSIVAVYDGIRSNELRITVKQPLKLYKVNKSYVKVAAPKAGKSSKKVTFTVKTNPTAKKFTDGGGRVTWAVTSKDTGISLKSDDGKGKAVFEVPSGALDTIVTATINDPVTGKIYSTDCMIDVK